MKRLIGLDYGDKRIGVALSDESRTIASPHSVIPHKGWGPTAKAVARIIQETDAEFVVMGLPCHLEGGLGKQAEEALGFARVLEKHGIKVMMQDERLTSVTAEDALKEGGKTARESKLLVDQVAAALILQAYLDAHRV